jgi:hypothetical protein
MYDLTFGQNGRFNLKPIKKTMCFSCPMFLVKVDILFNQCEDFNQVEPFEKP